VVALLARYPVKSLCGEVLDEVEVGLRGLAGDRGWAVYTEDGGIGSGKTTRRFRRVDGLLDLRATLDGASPVVECAGVRLPAERASALVSETLGRRVTLRPEGAVPHHDESPVHVVTTAALRRLSDLLGEPVDPARFRANVVLETLDPDTREPDADWAGRELRLGEEVVLRLGAAMPRCVMVDLPQRRLDRDGRILRALAADGDPVFGLQAHVVRGGRLRRGDEAVLG
jgi:uncharacterized protein YcbX